MTITTLDEGIVAYLSVYPGLVALVSDRVYYREIPQGATLPCVTCKRIDTPRDLTHDDVGATGTLAHPRFQLESWATTYLSSKAINDQIRAALNGHTGSVGYQTETATVAGTIVNPGNATVIVTATGMTGSAITTNVAVLAADTAAIVAGKIRTALLAVANITSFATVGGSGATVTLTRLSPGTAAISDFNISVDNGTCSGLTPAPSSAVTFNSIGISAALVDSETPDDGGDPSTGLERVTSDYIFWHQE